MAAKNSKLSLKSLQTEINVLKEQLESVKDELCHVKEELKELKSEPQLEKTKINHTTKNRQGDSSGRRFNCRACDNSFDSKKSLKVHIKASHPQTIKCNLCEETFEQNSDLERHIEEEHEKNRKYECDKCGKTFALRWRLGKHQESHASSKNKKCHYFNNNKVCPFEEIGCMFAHIVSDMCMYGQKCSHKLCSYQHEPCNSTSDKNYEHDEKENDATKITNIEAQEKESNKSDLKASKDSDAKNHLDKEQKFDCDVCLYRSSIQQELKDHMSNRGHNKEHK